MASQAAVLVVDDEPDVRELYAASLSGAYAVPTAGSGPDAPDRLEERTPVVERAGDEAFRALEGRPDALRERTDAAVDSAIGNGTAETSFRER